jgi:hypothetical protein
MAASGSLHNPASLLKERMTFRTFIRPECLGVDPLSYARISAICGLTSKLSGAAKRRSLQFDHLPPKLRRVSPWALSHN